ncbi:MAG: gamma-glutamylcyclotransferase [Bradymonadaceae bacterium]|nr:gamma-glutamylcyclotransferase [Lujinxingiaceae bacterium]
MTVLTYFAYGSNMLSNRLRGRVPSARPIGPAELHGWSLRFHKRGADGSAKCNVVLEPGGLVNGVLFEIAHAEKRRLDLAEGLGSGYEQATVSVTSLLGAVEGFLYVASASHIDEGLAPFDWYKDFVIYGALEHRLAIDYIGRLRAIEALSDPDVGRAIENRRILGV